MESTKNMARFTAPQAARIVADNGTKVVLFERGQTQAIHRDLFAAALREGLVPEEELEERDIPRAPEPQGSKEEMTAKKLIEACRDIIARGNPDDFTVVGQPRLSSVKKLVDFDSFTAKDVQAAFELAMFEVEQSGNESTKHPEPSSSDTA